MAIDEGKIAQAAQWIGEADGLLITAGAGMGVDSGLPDFRGTAGFWTAYPALGKERIDFQTIANQAAFEETPRLAWGFYGHRLDLYRRITPHDGFRILREIGNRMAQGAFVYTSNVDGQFQKAGFDDARIVECHGSIHYLQCLAACTTDIWPADALEIKIDEDRCMFRGPLPGCPHCGRLARPNILMFSDWTWLSGRTDSQHARLERWLARVKKPVVIELGAGTAIPSVRRKGESLQAPLVRINPTAAQVGSHGAVGIQAGALEALLQLEARLKL